MLAKIRGRRGIRQRRIRTAADLRGALLELVNNNLDEWPLPDLYEAGIRYKREGPQPLGEDWQDADRLLQTGAGDCEDLACYRVASLVGSGVDPAARPHAYSPKPGLVHIVVRRGDGYEDPSALLGMVSPMTSIKYQLGRNKRGGGWNVGLTVPIGGQPIEVYAVGRSPAAAVCGAIERIDSFNRSIGLPGVRRSYTIGADPAPSGSGLLDALRTAGSRWDAVAPNKSGTYASLVTPVREAVAFGTEVASKVDFSSQQNFLSSIASLAANAGPYGAVVGAVLDLLNKVGDWLTRQYPAFAVQVQPEHYARMEAWVARNVVNITEGTDSEAIAFMRAKGWVCLFGVHSGQFANNSDPDFGTWWESAEKSPQTVEAHLKNFAMVAGPRKDALFTKEISPSALSSWLDSEEGRASFPIGEKLALDLSGGPDQFTSGSWQDGACKSWSSEGLKFVSNYRLDLDPGDRSYTVGVNMVVVNTTKLPDALAAPLAEFLTFRGAAQDKGMGWDQDMSKRAMQAAFGNAEGEPVIRGVKTPRPQAFESWNLLRFIYHAMIRRDTYPLAVVGTLANRAPLDSSDTVTIRPVADAQLPVGDKPPAGTATPIAMLRGLQTAAPSAPLAAPEPPLLAPETARKLAVIRELAELAQSGNLAALRREEKRGGAVGRFIRGLMQGF